MRSLQRWKATALAVASALAVTLGPYVGATEAQQQQAVQSPDITGIWRVYASAENVAPNVTNESGSHGEVPYTPEALALQQENARYWLGRDPVLTECSSPGVPRATYIRSLIDIQQNADQITMSYEFGDPRVIYMEDVSLGQASGRWEDNILLIEDNTPSTQQYTWLDARGNYYPNTATVIERYIVLNQDLLIYDVKIDDELSFTNPWTISIPLARDTGGRLSTIECRELVQELVAGRLTNEDIVVPRGELVAWERYPSGLFFSRGGRVATISPGERYGVVERRVISPIFSPERHYYKIAPLGIPNNPCVNTDCWVYAGDGLQSNLVPLVGSM